ncbi:MAG TPA: DUF6058 family natural product biosynthesis protein [Caulobacteraceae bacterium]|nr:DUF6058 family natural product biosynthesis protein [Caulobacteraceae bacterium]
MTAGYDETLAYLEGRYLAHDRLADAAGLTPERLDTLIEAGLTPGPSHVATFALTVEAVINGAHETTPKRVRYFHRDLVETVREADALARDVGPEPAVAALRERHDRAVAAEAGLAAGSPEHAALCERAWTHWRSGTHGVCLQRFDAASMIRKVLATERMQQALSAAAEGRPVDRADLADAAARYASVTGPFGPHERDGSTRARIYEPALALLARLQAEDQAPILTTAG